MALDGEQWLIGRRFICTRALFGERCIFPKEGSSIHFHSQVPFLHRQCLAVWRLGYRAAWRPVSSQAKGNAAFKEGNWAAARTSYAKGATFVADLFKKVWVLGSPFLRFGPILVSLGRALLCDAVSPYFGHIGLPPQDDETALEEATEADKAQAKDVALALHQNSAQANLKLAEYNGAICDCNSALDIDGSSVKALFRRGQVWMSAMLGNAHTPAHTHAHTGTLAGMHAYTRARAHTHTHAHTH